MKRPWLKTTVSQHLVSRLSKNKHDLFFEFESGVNHGQILKREGKEEDVENALFLWFEQKLGQGACLSGLFLKQKACDMACAQKNLIFSMERSPLYKIILYVYVCVYHKIFHFLPYTRK